MRARMLTIRPTTVLRDLASSYLERDSDEMSATTRRSLASFLRRRDGGSGDGDSNGFVSKWFKRGNGRFVTFWRNVLTDYREAFQELGKSMAARPIRATTVTATALTALHLNRTNPDELTFRQAFLEHARILTIVPDSIRGCEAERTHDAIADCLNCGLLRRRNLGLFSIMWRDRFSDQVGAFTATCEYTKPRFLETLGLWRSDSRLVDIGFLGRWWILEKKMHDCDINEDEWDELGRPRNPVRL